MLSSHGDRVVSVVGGGWSFSEVDQSMVPGHIIAVNDAAKHLERWDAAVSMDHRWAENRWKFLVEKARPTWLRHKYRKLAENMVCDWVTWFRCDEKTVIFGPQPDLLNGSNSGVVALNLAWLLRPQALFMFGFDMQRGPRGESHWYPNYEWRTESNPKGTSVPVLNRWAGEMNAVRWQMERAGIRVLNVSSRSKIEAFQRVTPRALGMGR